jgi:transcriptional regulator with XRE-family HTH domain
MSNYVNSLHKIFQGEAGETMNVARNIKKYREMRDITQEELASKTDVTQEHISRIERGTKKPSFELAARIAKALDVTTDQLLND